MSAFICDNKTISVLARAFFDYQVTFEGLPPKSGIDMILVDVNKEVDAIGQALLDYNYKSVNYRYSEDEKAPEFHCEEVTFDEGIVLGCLECYDYQACEPEDYYESYIYKNLLRMKDALLKRLIRKAGMKVPYGYDGHNMMEG